MSEGLIDFMNSILDILTRGFSDETLAVVVVGLLVLFAVVAMVKYGSRAKWSEPAVQDSYGGFKGATSISVNVGAIGNTTYASRERRVDAGEDGQRSNLTARRLAELKRIAELSGDDDEHLSVS